jgi:hypothetical protein
MIRQDTRPWEAPVLPPEWHPFVDRLATLPQDGQQAGSVFGVCPNAQVPQAGAPDRLVASISINLGKSLVDL